MSDSVWPYGQQPSRLLCPWDSLGKNTGVGCHFLFQCMKVKSESEVAQSCPTLSDPVDCSLPASSIHGIFLARGLEWGAIAFSQMMLGLKLLEVHLTTLKSLRKERGTLQIDFITFQDLYSLQISMSVNLLCISLISNTVTLYFEINIWLWNEWKNWMKFCWDLWFKNRLNFTFICIWNYVRALSLPPLIVLLSILKWS